MALTMVTSLVNVANAAITDGKYGEAQVYDVFRSGCNGGATCNIYNFSAPYLGSWMSGTRVSWAAGDYISFVNVSGTNYSLVQYNSAGNQKAVVQTGGTITALGDGIVYIGQQGSTGYFFSNSQGIANPSQYTFSNPYSPQNMDYTVTASDLASYAATSTVLTAGQTASSGGGSPTVVSTNTTNQVSSSSSNGTPTTTSSTSYGTPTSTDVITYGTPAITVAVVNHRGEQTSKTLQIDQVTTTTVQTPVTTTTTTVTPYTTTTTVTTPVTTTTTTTPVTVTTYSDGTTTTTNGTPVVTTSTSNSVSSSQASGTTTTVSANTITDTQISSTTSPYFTRIDQFSMLNQNNRIQNLQLISDPLSLHRIVNGEIRLTYANVNERTTLTVHGSQGQSNTVDGYTSKIGSYGLSLDRKISDSLLIGGTLLQTYQSLSGNNSTGKLDREVVNLYSLYVKNDWLLKADVGYARGRFATSHSLPELSLMNEANTTGSDRWGQLRLYTPNLAGFRLLAGARIENNGIAATTDTGSELSAIMYPQYSVTNKTTEYGIRKDHYFNDRFSGYVEATKNSQDVSIYKGGLNYAVSNRVLIQANTSTIQFNENKIINYGIAARILF